MLPESRKLFKWGTQARRLYDYLANGPATAEQIVQHTGILNYQKTILKMRERLQGTGVTVKSFPLNGKRTRWAYRLGTLDTTTEVRQ